MTPLDQAPLAVQELVDQVSDRFEAAWSSGNRPRIEDQLAQVPGDVQPVLLLELIKIEFACRQRLGELPRSEEYRQRFAAWPSVVDAALADAAPLAAPPAASVTLTVIQGAQSGEKFTAQSHQTVVVGRAEDASWRFTQDKYFSRYQFRVEFQPPTCQIVDLESRNGTLVNGARITQAELTHGDRIECGETIFEVSVVEPPQPMECATLDLPRGVSLLPTVEHAPTKTAVPQRLADFQVVSEIGRGAMGVVYRAIHLPSGREAAVKLIQPETAAMPEAVQLFLREAHILSQLRHPRIVEYLSLGLHEGQMYLAMEYLPTISLRELLASQSRPRQIRLACGLACYMLEALEYAHQRDVVHRDVKPSNVLVYKVGKKVSLKLADFGLAKNYLHAGFSSMTHENEIRGTLAYMAPEQLINCRYAKPACDIYSAGACLYYFLCGQAPYQVDSKANSLARLLNSAPIPITQRSPDIPMELAGIVDRSLAREPAQRFASAAQMKSALESFKAQTT